jgi:lipopolysaccharide transport system permease protein
MGYIASIFLVLSFLLFASYALSLICARFRDLIQLVSATMQVMFLVTPVMWQLQFLPEQYRAYLLLLNPFASMLELLRNPILGLAVDNIAYLSISIWLIVALSAAALFHRQWGRSIIFWL